MVHIAQTAQVIGFDIHMPKIGFFTHLSYSPPRWLIGFCQILYSYWLQWLWWYNWPRTMLWHTVVDTINGIVNDRYDDIHISSHEEWHFSLVQSCAIHLATEKWQLFQVVPFHATIHHYKMLIMTSIFIHDHLVIPKLLWNFFVACSEIPQCLNCASFMNQTVKYGLFLLIGCIQLRSATETHFLLSIYNDKCADNIRIWGQEGLRSSVKD